MLTELYPSSKFYSSTYEKVNSIDQKRQPLVWIALLRLTDVSVKWGANPYLSFSKCHGVEKPVLDNGRIHNAKLLHTWITNVDWEIIQWCYDFERADIANLLFARAKELPEFMRQGVMDYYIPKTLLKDVDGKEYEYMKSKNNVNACYGMTVTDIAKDDWLYDEIGEYVLEPDNDVQARLNRYYASRKNFMQYQQGIWVPAYCRRNLNLALKELGSDKVYWDTDSAKYFDEDGKHEIYFQRRNQEIIALAKKYGAYAKDRNGNIIYMGVWDDEGIYTRFKTLGAKKYIVEKKNKKGKLEIASTIAGVSKKAGAAYFKKNGFKAFRIGTIIQDAGNLAATYNNDEIHEITVNGCSFTTASNVCLLDTPYTLGITKDYANLLDI